MHKNKWKCAFSTRESNDHLSCHTVCHSISKTCQQTVLLKDRGQFIDRRQSARQHSTLPTLTNTSSSTRSPIPILGHLFAQAACLQQFGLCHWQSEKEHTEFPLFEKQSCVFLPQCMILMPTGIFSHMHFHTLYAYFTSWIMDNYTASYLSATVQYKHSVKHCVSIQLTEGTTSSSVLYNCL